MIASWIDALGEPGVERVADRALRAGLLAGDQGVGVRLAQPRRWRAAAAGAPPRARPTWTRWSSTGSAYSCAMPLVGCAPHEPQARPSRSSAPASAGSRPPSRRGVPGIEDIVILDRAERVGGVWEANTYPGAACDVPVAPVLAVVRAEPGLDAALLAAGRDPRRTWSRSPATSASSRCCASARTSRAPRGTSDAGRWHLRGRGRPRRRGGRARPRLRAAHAPVGAGPARAWASFTRRRVPLRVVGPRPRPARAGGSPSSAPARARSSSCRRSPTRSSTSRSSSARRRGRCPSPTSPTAAARSGSTSALRACSGRCARPGAAFAGDARADVHRGARRWSRARPRPSLTGAVGPAAPRAAARPPGPAGGHAARTTRSAASASSITTDWFRALRRPNVDLVTEPIAQVRPGRGRDRRRPPPRGRRPDLRHRLHGDGLPGADGGHRPGRRRACARRGRGAPRPTTGSPCRGSRTCS